MSMYTQTNVCKNYISQLWYDRYAAHPQQWLYIMIMCAVYFCLCFVFLAEECKKKWKNLSDTYRWEGNKLKDQKRSGSAAGGKQWKNSAIMGFLNPFMEAKASSGNMPERVGEPMMATDEKRRPNWKVKQISQADPAFSQAHTTSQADKMWRQKGERFKNQHALPGHKHSSLSSAGSCVEHRWP